MKKPWPLALKVITGLAVASIFLAAGAAEGEPPKMPRNISPGYGDATPWQALMMAIGNQDLDELRVLLEGGLDPNAADPSSGLTPLMIAETLPLASALLDHGADVNRTDAEGATALHHAVFAPQAISIVQRLLQHRPDVDAIASGDGDQTPLLKCRQLFFEGNDAATGARLMKILVESGASIDAADDLGYTVLMTAAVNEKPELARVALELGADPSLENQDGESALDLARETSPRVYRILMQHR